MAGTKKNIETSRARRDHDGMMRSRRRRSLGPGRNLGTATVQVLPAFCLDYHLNWALSKADGASFDRQKKRTSLLRVHYSNAPFTGSRRHLCVPRALPGGGHTT